MNSTEYTGGCFKYPSPSHFLACQGPAGWRDVPRSQAQGVLVVSIQPLISSLLSFQLSNGEKTSPEGDDRFRRVGEGDLSLHGCVGAHLHHGRVRTSSRRCFSLHPIIWELTSFLSWVWLPFSSPSPCPEKQSGQDTGTGQG